MRTSAAVLAIASVVSLEACGGGGGTPIAPSTPAPTPASRAEVTGHGRLGPLDPLLTGAGVA